MSLSDFSIRNSVFAWMLMAGLIIFGLISFRSLGISEMPDVDFPMITVHLNYEGASPTVMENEVVDVLEDVLGSVQGIRSVNASAKQDEATISLEFNLDRPVDDCMQDVEAKIAQVRMLLPKDMDPPVIEKFNLEDMPIMWISLSSDKPIREVIEYARDNIKDKLQMANGVGEIMFGGYLAPAIRIWIDPKKLAQFEITAIDIANAIAREHTEIPAGRIETSTKEINIRTMGETYSVEELGNIVISKRGGAAIYQTVLLKDVAKVELGLEDVRRISRVNQKTALGLGVKKLRGSNAVEVANEVKEQIVEIRKTLPKEYKMEVNFDATRFIEQNTDELNFNLILSAILTSVVCLLFLASWGATFNVLLAIPTSILGAFMVVKYFGFTLNTFTLLGLTLAVGIVVDDAIMVLENIIRHQEMGKDRITAARDGAREITPAAMATTLAILAVFVPVVFMDGVIGKFFFQFGITLSATVAISLLEALTITPMRASRFIARKKQETRFSKFVFSTFEKWAASYKKLLGVCLEHRWKVLGAGVVFFVLAIFSPSIKIYPALSGEFVPAQDQSSVLVRLETPLGSSIAFTDNKVKEVEAIVVKNPNVIRYYVAVGGFGGGDVSSAMMFITLKQPRDRPKDEKTGKRLTQKQIMARLRDDLGQVKDITPTLQDLSQRGFSPKRGFPVEFSFRGGDWEKLKEMKTKMMDLMEKSGLYKDIDTDYREGQPEIQVIPLRDEAFKRGVSIADIGMTVRYLIGGAEVGKFTEAGHRNDIRIRLSEEARQSKDDIANLLIRNQFGELVRLGDVAQLIERATVKTITHEQSTRAINISANMAEKVTQVQALEKVKELASTILPPDIQFVQAGASETMKESFESLFLAMWLGLIVAYMILGSQYNSFIHPITVLLALPFSIAGAIMALRVTHNTLNIFSMIGIILLMGIAKKNSILLVDFTNQRRKEGMGVRDALLTACPQRLRPILMTSIATIAAAIPPVLGVGAGAEARVPMALTIIGGMTISTILTLFVVPCAYSLFSRMERKSVDSDS